MSSKAFVTMHNWQQQVPATIGRYQEMRQHTPSMYRHTIRLFRDMATGGKGDDLSFNPEWQETDWQEALVEALQPVDVQPTGRNYNYPGVPDRFFQLVLQGLGVEY